MSTKVLVVDDDPGVRAMLYRHLSDKGWSVDVASEKEEGLALLSCCEYQAVVTDLRLSKHSLSDGMEIIALARARFPAAAIVACTGYDDADLFVRARRHGATEVLLKPARLAVLSRALSSIR